MGGLPKIENMTLTFQNNAPPITIDSEMITREENILLRLFFSNLALIHQNHHHRNHQDYQWDHPSGVPQRSPPRLKRRTTTRTTDTSFRWQRGGAAGPPPGPSTPPPLLFTIVCQPPSSSSLHFYLFPVGAGRIL